MRHPPPANSVPPFTRRACSPYVRLVITFLVLAAPSFRADAQTATLPLRGYYKPGRYMPVRIEGFGTACSISADGIITTQVVSAEGRIVPVLPTASAISPIRISVSGREPIAATPAPRSLPLGERLVAVTFAAFEPSARRLFPGEPVTVVVIAASDFLSARPQSWDALDGVVTDSGVIEALDSEKMRGLIDQGLTLATPESSSDRIKDWKRQGDLRVLRSEIVGPAGALLGETAYLPVAGWEPGHPAAFRRQIVVVAVIVVLLLLCCTLLPRRASIGAMLSVGILASLGIGMWNARLSSVRTVAGRIAVVGETDVQTDTWTYATSRGEDSINIPLEGAAWPLISGTSHAQALGLKIVDGADGTIAARAQLRGGVRLGWLSRSTARASFAVASEPVRSPLAEVARRLYAGGGYRVSGERSESDVEWRTIHLSREK